MRTTHIRYLAEPAWAPAGVRVHRVNMSAFRLTVSYAVDEYAVDIPAHLWAPVASWSFALGSWYAKPAAHVAVQPPFCNAHA